MDADVYLYIFVTEKYFIDILKYNENIYLFPLYCISLYHPENSSFHFCLQIPPLPCCPAIINYGFSLLKLLKFFLTNTNKIYL